MSQEEARPTDPQAVQMPPVDTPPTPAPGPKPEPKSVRVRTLALAAAAIAAIGGTAGMLGNIEKLSGPLASIGVFAGERGAAAAIAKESIRNRLGRAALDRTHPDGIACFNRAVPIDLDGDGVKSDLAVVFQRTPKPSDCRDLDFPEDVAFYTSAWNGYQYIGDPELPAAVTAWNFAGPAAFREQADSSYPAIHVYMLRDGKIAEVGQIDTASADEYSGTQYIETKDGLAAWVVNAAGITKVSFGKDGKPLVEQLDGKRLVAENQGLHLLSYDAEGHLSLDGDPFLVQSDPSAASAPSADGSLDTATPNDGDHFVIKLSPGYHLYLVGCSPNTGLNAVAAEPGAFAIDFGKSPSVDCALGEDRKFTIAIAQMGY